MKIIYLNKQNESFKTLENGSIIDLIKTDIQVRKVGIEYEKDGDLYRILWAGLMINPDSEEYISLFKKELKKASGEWLETSENYSKKAEFNTFRYNNKTAESFAQIEENPLDADGIIKPDLVNEIEFFSQNVGCEINISLFNVFAETIQNIITTEL